HHPDDQSDPPCKRRRQDDPHHSPSCRGFTRLTVDHRCAYRRSVIGLASWSRLLSSYGARDSARVCLRRTWRVGPEWHSPSSAPTSRAGVRPACRCWPGSSPPPVTSSCSTLLPPRRRSAAYLTPRLDADSASAERRSTRLRRSGGPATSGCSAASPEAITR